MLYGVFNWLPIGTVTPGHTSHHSVHIIHVFILGTCITKFHSKWVILKCVQCTQCVEQHENAFSYSIFVLIRLNISFIISSSISWMEIDWIYIMHTIIGRTKSRRIPQNCCRTPQIPQNCCRIPLDHQQFNLQLTFYRTSNRSYTFLGSVIK